MTEEIWSALLACIIAAENHDNSMSGNLTRQADKARDWLMTQEWSN